MTALRRFAVLTVIAFVSLVVALHAKTHGAGGIGPIVGLGLLGAIAIDSLAARLGFPSVLGTAGMTLAQSWPLQSDSGNNPTLNPGGVTSFKFNDVPIAAATGPLAYYLPGVFITFTGNVVQSGSTGSAVFSDQFFGALFSSLDWIQSFYGTVLRSTHVKGAQWCVTEWAASGYRYAGLQRGTVAAAANGTYPFEVTIFVPANSLRHKRVERSTMNLALLYRTSQLRINVAPTSVITGLSTGSSITSFKATCSARLVPWQRLVLGTPFEVVLSEPTVNASQVTIPNFGTDSGFQGTEAGGGVAWLAELSGALSLGGGITPANITSLAFPWRGQSFTPNVLDVFNQWRSALPERFTDKLNNVNSLITGTAILQGAPYIVNNPTQVGAAGGTVNAELVNLLFWAWVTYSDDELDLSNLQTANSDQSYTLNGTGTGTREIHGIYGRSWQEGMVRQWAAQVRGSGLYDQVYGKSATAPAVFSRVSPHGGGQLTGDQTRYLPYEMSPAPVRGNIPLPPTSIIHGA